LAGEAAACATCPALACETAVLGPTGGSLDSPVVFVAEAPGRLGAGRTGIPFSGDRSGKNFETLIAHAGLRREDIFITNAVLCTPLEEGRNRTPRASEISNCSCFLRQVLDLISPRLVVTLGAVGLKVVNRLLDSRFTLPEGKARPHRAENFTLLPLYHPSPRVTNWRRSMEQQKKDFIQLRKLLREEQERPTGLPNR